MPVEIVLVALTDRLANARFPAVLRRSGARVTLLGNPRLAMRWSRFVDRRIACGQDPSSVTAELRKLAQDASPPWIILIDAASIAAVATCRGEDWLNRVFPVDQRGPMAEAILSKTAFMTMASQAKLAIAPMRICRQAADLEEAGNALGYPMALYRDLALDRGGIVKVDDAAGAQAAFARLKASGPVLAQKIVQGKKGTTNMLLHRGRLVCWSSWHVLRTYGDSAVPCVMKAAQHPQLDELVREAGRLTGFNGFCGLDWVEDSAGQFLLTQFHGRPTAGLHVGRYNGVDFSRALGEMFYGVLRTQKPRLRQPPPVVHLFPQDVQRCLSRFDILGLLGWLPRIFGKDIPWNDPGLLARYVLDFLHVTGQRTRPPVEAGHHVAVNVL